MTPELHRYLVGELGVTVLSDGVRIIGSLQDYILNAKVEDLQATLSQAGLPTDHIRSHYNVVVVETGAGLVLLETGIGEAMQAPTSGARGRLLGNLAAAGIAPDDIALVAVSHFHPDHINGLIRADGRPAFPAARILVPEGEWRYWMDDAAMARAADARIAGLFDNARRVFAALGRPDFFAWGDEIAPGISAVAAPGHTPGHSCFLLSSNGQQVLVQGDLNNQEAVFTRHPDWLFYFDEDPETARDTRRSIYEDLADRRIPVQAYHHPFPGLALVERDGPGFRLVPIAGVPAGKTQTHWPSRQVAIT